MTTESLASNASGFNHIIAFDVAKDSLTVLAMPGARTSTIANTQAAVERLLRKESKHNAAARADGKDLGAPLVICEATGGYEKPVLDAAAKLAMACHRAHGSRMRAFARYEGHLAKTDPIDVAIIARFGAQTKADRLRLYQAPRPELETLRALQRRREDMLSLKLAEQNRLDHPTTHRAVKPSLRAVIGSLEAQLSTIETEIENLLTQDAEFAHNAELMRSVVGVGPRTTATLLAYMPELGSVDRGQIAMLAGLAPINKDSGKAVGVRHIAAGRAEVRKCLWMAATCAIRHNPVLRDFRRTLERQALQGHRYRRHAKAARDPQCHHRRAKTLEARSIEIHLKKRLHGNTVDLCQRQIDLWLKVPVRITAQRPRTNPARLDCLFRSMLFSIPDASASSNARA